MTRILIVDDELAIRTVISTFLEESGFKVETTESGLEGLEKFRRFNPDVVVTDVNMPMMGGILFAKRLREIGFNGLIIFGTASLVDGIVPPILVFKKPYKISSLIDAIVTYSG